MDIEVKILGDRIYEEWRIGAYTEDEIGEKKFYTHDRYNLYIPYIRCVCVCVCVYIYIYIYTHTHTFIYILHTPCIRFIYILYILHTDTYVCMYMRNKMEEIHREEHDGYIFGEEDGDMGENKKPHSFICMLCMAAFVLQLQR